jgi:hypothetical protein
MGRLSVEVKLCGGDCSLVVSYKKFASPYTLAVEQACATVEYHILVAGIALSRRVQAASLFGHHCFCSHAEQD